MSTAPGAAIPRDPIERIIDETLRREGWPIFTDRPSDRGGPTKGGITLATLTAYRKQPCSSVDVAALGEAEVRAIYRRCYVEAPGYAGIANAPLRTLVVDCAVLYGEDDASPWLQRAAKDLGAVLAVDGKVGPKTLAVVNALDPCRLIRRICVYRLRKMGRVITDDAKRRGRTEDQALNAAGWSNRLAEFMEV